MKAYKYKLKLNRAFASNCAMTLDLCRELYNASLQERRGAYSIRHLSLNYHDQRKQLPEIKLIRPEVAGVHSQVLQDVLRRCDKAFDHFFRRLKKGETPGYPRFKGRDRFNSFCYPQSGFRLEGDKLHLSKIGSCRLRLSRPVEGRIKTCTIKREESGWFVIFAVEPNQSRFIPKTGKKVAVDVGLTHFATLSTGERIHNPRFYRAAEQKLGEAQRKLSTKKRGSNKRRAAKKIVAQAHRKIANQRQHFFHHTANELLKRYDEIHLEDLQIRQMIRQSHLAKSISDAGWGTFISITAHKAEEAGKQVRKKVAAGTSQTCSRCGHQLEVKLKLSDRVFECPKCGQRMDRDWNSAINILNGRASRRKK